MNLLALMRNFTIRTRMFGAIAMVLAMFTLVGLAGFYGGIELRSLNREILLQSTGEQRHVSEMRAHLAAVRLFEKQMVIDYEDGVAVLKHRDLMGGHFGGVQPEAHGETLLAADHD